MNLPVPWVCLMHNHYSVSRFLSPFWLSHYLIWRQGELQGALVPSELHSGPSFQGQRQNQPLFAFSQSQTGNKTSGQISEASPNSECQWDFGAHSFEQPLLKYLTAEIHKPDKAGLICDRLNSSLPIKDIIIIPGIHRLLGNFHHMELKLLKDRIWYDLHIFQIFMIIHYVAYPYICLSNDVDLIFFMN